MKSMTDRNPHTGEKLQSKANSDAYRNNFDAIFRRPATTEIVPDETITKEEKEMTGFDFFTKDEFEQMALMKVLVPTDGMGYWGTKLNASNIKVFETEAPEWATHVYWYNK